MYTEYRNNFVSLQVLSESTSINCAFMRVTNISCNATITYGENCQVQASIVGTRDTNNDLLVVISLRSFLEETRSSKYCGFIINATANTRTVTVDGSLLGKLHKIRNIIDTL